MVPISYFIFHVVCVFKSLNPVRDHLFNIDLRVHLSCIYSMKSSAITTVHNCLHQTDILADKNTGHQVTSD